MLCLDKIKRSESLRIQAYLLNRDAVLHLSALLLHFACLHLCFIVTLFIVYFVILTSALESSHTFLTNFYSYLCILFSLILSLFEGKNYL